MAYEEVQGSTNGGGEFEEREFVSAKIGAEFEGVFRSMGPRTPSKYNEGEHYRVAALDLNDGRKIAVRAGKILLERLEGAGLSDGDRVKIVVESGTTKDGKRTYALPRLFVDRSAAPAPAPQAAKSAPVAEDDEPPF